jgi:bifunctional DNA-binding transcriptional regulator/antitoxin component of YhaV-PrlF toxin-antitoxin module
MAKPEGMSYGRARVSSRHRLTIPAHQFKAARLQIGDTLQVEAVGAGRLVLTNLEQQLDRFDGCLGSGAFPEDFLDQLRSEWR